MPVTHAPKGGVVIAGHMFRAGAFIPTSVMAQARGEAGLNGPDLSAMLKNLSKHRGNADAKHVDHLRKVHDILKEHHGEHADKRIEAEAKAIHDAHDKTKDPAHKAHLSMRLGSMHAAMDDGSGGSAPAASGSGAAGIHAPTEVAESKPEGGSKQESGKSITLLKESGGYTAYIGKPGEEEASGATAEEAIGKLVMENAASLGITIQGDKKVDAEPPDKP